MPLPDRLKPVHPTATLRSLMKDLVRKIVEKIDECKEEEDPEIIELITQWNSHSTRAFEFHEFRDFYSYTDEKSFIKTAFHKPAYVPDLSLTEVLALIDYVCGAEGDDADQNYALNLLEENFPNANVSDLIYWPNEWFQDETMLHVELSSEEIAAYLMKRSGRSWADAPDVQLAYPIPAESVS